MKVLSGGENIDERIDRQLEKKCSETEGGRIGRLQWIVDVHARRMLLRTMEREIASETRTIGIRSHRTQERHIVPVSTGHRISDKDEYCTIRSESGLDTMASMAGLGGGGGLAWLYVQRRC